MAQQRALRRDDLHGRDLKLDLARREVNAANGLRDARDVVIAEIRIDRQRHDAGRDRVGDRPRVRVEPRVCLLAVHRRVEIAARLDALGGKRENKLVAVSPKASASIEIVKSLYVE